MTSHSETPAPKGERSGLLGGGLEQITAAPPEDQCLREYPYAPGVRHNSTGGTAQAAAAIIKPVALTLEQWCRRAILNTPHTPEEAQVWISQQLGRSVLLNSIRPRYSAMSRKGLVEDSGERGLGEGGRCAAIRWRLTEAGRLLTAREVGGGEEQPTWLATPLGGQALRLRYRTAQ